MKIRLLSDLHLEQMHGFKYDFIGEDVVVLAGDIHTRNRHAEIIDQIPSTVPVLMVAGNHEYFGSVYHEVNEYLNDLTLLYPNFKFLNCESCSLGDVEFFGGMMCTDFSLYGLENRWFAIDAAKNSIADFEYSKISDGGEVRNWSTEDHLSEFKRYSRALGGWLSATEGKKRVVISHFIPHPSAIAPRFRDPRNMLNPYFTADMDRFMGFDGAWLFGHTHNSVDIKIGDTRVVSNPHGYGFENYDDFDPRKIIEI